MTLLLEVLGAETPIAYDPLHRFSIALMGAVSLGWGATLLAVARITPELSAPQAQKLWRMVTWSVLLWFVVDSALSSRPASGAMRSPTRCCWAGICC